MENPILLNFLESILGSSVRGTGTNRKFKCPFHASSTLDKKKLEIDLETDSNGYNLGHCWVCGEKFKTIRSLLWKLNANKDKFDKLDTIVIRGKNEKNEHEKFNGLLPDEYVFLPDADSRNIIVKHARHYLKKRGITEDDIFRYQIGYCDDGPYAERIIIPSYDIKGNMNFFVGRSFEADVYMKYKFPMVSKDIIPFELYINWNLPIILCEGGFDMISIKRNVIPLLGKQISNALKKKLISSKVKTIYVVLDNDALKDAIEHCRDLISYGKEVYLVIPDEGKDPSEMGFDKFTKLIQKATPLTLGKILQLKTTL
jgi:DNA primase